MIAFMLSVSSLYNDLLLMRQRGVRGWGRRIVPRWSRRQRGLMPRCYGRIIPIHIWIGLIDDGRLIYRLRLR